MSLYIQNTTGEINIYLLTHTKLGFKANSPRMMRRIALSWESVGDFLPSGNPTAIQYSRRGIYIFTECQVIGFNEHALLSTHRTLDFLDPA